MAFPQSFMDELTARSDIVDVVGSYVQLTRKGGNLLGLCPFHSEKTRSFPSRRTSRSITASAAKRAAALSTSSWRLKTSPFRRLCAFWPSGPVWRFPEEEGDREAGRRRQRLLDLNRDAARFYYQLLQQPEGRAVQEYLDKRQITKIHCRQIRHGRLAGRMGRTADRHDAKRATPSPNCWSAGLGGAEQKWRPYMINSATGSMLPVIDTRGDVVAFGSRVLDKSEPKYMNSSETPVYSKRRVLYGLNLAKKSKRPNIILCEGNLDIVTLHQAGLRQCRGLHGNGADGGADPASQPFHQGIGPLL